MSGYTMPLTLRQVYYRLVAVGLIPNTRSNYNQLSSQLVTARENDDIDDTRIVDRNRRIEDVSFDSPESFIEVCQTTLRRRYVRRFWDSQPVYCEVWVEKDALSQVIAEAVYPFNTVVAPSRGYSSYSYLREAAGRISQYGNQCWELDAIEPSELVRLCQSAVEGMVTDNNAWLAIKEKDKADREALLSQLEGIKLWGGNE